MSESDSYPKAEYFPKTEFVQKFTEWAEVWIEYTTW